MSDTPNRPSCGHTDDDRALIPVIDETGATNICGLCLIGELPRWTQAGAVTVFVALPTALRT